MTSGPKRLFPGTVDLLVLKTLTAGPSHGFGISRGLRAESEDLIVLKDAALYQALHRMERQGWIEGEWGHSDAGKRARFYRLTRSGEARLAEESRTFRQYAAAVLRILGEPAG
ncbi:MAG: PadR family transcriptional regulator [Gemmatimonadetes bacterium]|nr:PadR family transcriptional regulator [Gemmatimonadota bacterium]